MAQTGFEALLGVLWLRRSMMTIIRSDKTQIMKKIHDLKGRRLLSLI